MYPYISCEHEHEHVYLSIGHKELIVWITTDPGFEQNID